MAEAGHGDAGVRLELTGKTDQIDELRARHDDVLVQLDEPRRTERVGKFAAQFPDRLTRGLVAGFLNGESPERVDERTERGEILQDRVAAAVELDDEMGVAIGEHLGAEIIARRFQSKAISDLESGRLPSAVQNRLDCLCGDFKGRERRRQHRPRLGMGNEPQGRLRDDTEETFGTHEHADEVETGFVFMTASASFEDLPVGEDDLEAEHIMPSDSVFHAAGTARVRGDGAADRAFFETGRIGRVIPAERADGLLQVIENHPRLDHGDAVGRIDFEDAVHFPNRKENPAPDRDTAAHITDARSAGRHGDVVLAREAHRRNDFVPRSRLDDGLGHGRGMPAIHTELAPDLCRSGYPRFPDGPGESLEPLRFPLHAHQFVNHIHTLGKKMIAPTRAAATAAMRTPPAAASFAMPMPRSTSG